MQLQTMRDIWDQHARLLRVLQSLMQALKGAPTADGGGTHARLFDVVRAALLNIDDVDASGHPQGLRDILDGMRWLERQSWTDETVLFELVQLMLVDGYLTLERQRLLEADIGHALACQRHRLWQDACAA
ncbi:MAG: hypothetical protein A3E51_10105 [Burkholderiales bacterium RIFCSPHIGHO2_12_FULL_67_38]|nr:MAG: hypothetical protein A3I64_24055 [Burkholderiales bacterium RIFCSPLOWO2_02_FULL_67_64]OGB50770.1 MAG: hypothetical protein A3E51_10105 [Burkholderiales bacterium RIFCSPHIGHO2_12_FULL_67_38]